MVTKKRAPIPLVPPRVKSRKRARQIITQFHKLTKEAEQLSASDEMGGAENIARLRRIEAELAQLGGREAYQSASLLSVSFHNTSKWVTQQLSKMGLRPGPGAPSLRVLEVGAINTRLLDVPWMDVRAIDLKSQHPKIEERDFFSLEPRGEYDVISSSMVINCVPSPKRRGDMLVAYRGHLRLGGHLFLTLPLLCLTKSSHTTRESFVGTLREVGFSIKETRESPKVAFFCAVAMSDAPRDASTTGQDAGRGERHEGKADRSQGQKAAVTHDRRKRKIRGGNDFEIQL